MFKVYLCIMQQHDVRRAVLAAAVCLFSSLVAFLIYARATGDGTWRRRALVCLAGLVAGSGAWAAHFVGMLAFRTGLKDGVTSGGLTASMACAVAGMTAALFLAAGAARAFSAWRRLAGGLVAGAAIAAMHYASLLDYRTTGRIIWDWRYVAASLAVALGFSLMAMRLGRPGAGPRGWVAAGVVFGLGVLGLHFTAMTAVTIIPDLTVETPAALIPVSALTDIEVGVAALVTLAALAVIATDMAARTTELHRLKQALDAMPESLAFYDPEDRLVAWNAQYERLCGPAAPLRAGRHFMDIALAKVHDGHISQAKGRELEWIDARMAARREGGRSLEVYTDEGRWLQIIDSRTPDGGTVTVGVDVSDLKEAESAMSRARDAAEAANRIKTQFLANMSHELRTPLNGIVGMNALLMTTDLDPKQRRLAEVVRDSADALLLLINDMFDIARLEAGDIDVASQPIDLAGVLEATGQRYEPQARAKGIVMDWDIDDDGRQPFIGDTQRLQQVLGNLVSNAIKFTDGGSVSIAARRIGEASDQLRIEVRDTGIGVSADARARLFEPFHQADDSATRRHGGAGLGLAISRHLVRLMKGEIGLSDNLPAGSVFWVELPSRPVSAGRV